jgi:hypothetical protein
MGGTIFSTERPLESFESLQLGPWPSYTGMSIGGDRIPARGLTSGEGQVGEKVQELTAITGVAGVGEERGRGGESTVEQGRTAGLRGTTTVFRWPEGRRVARKWLDSFHAMMWCWWCAWQGLRGDGAAER